MTTKQAADIIRMLLGYLKGEIEPPKQETIEEAKAFEQQGYECLEMAIKALEQQPCEDCISRQAVLDSFWKLDTELRPSAIDAIVNMINNLPSVTPKEKTGKWIRTTDKSEHLVWECDKCGWQQRFNTNFCPDCGARMVESQESEVNNG